MSSESTSPEPVRFDGIPTPLGARLRIVPAAARPGGWYLVVTMESPSDTRHAEVFLDDETLDQLGRLVDAVRGLRS